MHKPYHNPLVPNSIYHLFNRAVGNEKLFATTENYRFFLQKYFEHTGNICDTFCYCLLPNHFHLLVKIKPEKELEMYFEQIKSKKLSHSSFGTLSDFIMERFSNWLNSYTKAFNKMYSRKGGLFIDYTKRQLIENDASFAKLIHYVHANPVHHGYCNTIEEWTYSSYLEILSNVPTKFLRNEIFDFFGSKEQFILFHKQPIERRQNL